MVFECYALCFCAIHLYVCYVLTFLSYGVEKISSRVCSFPLISIFFVLQMLERIKIGCSIHSIKVFNEMDE